MQRQAASAAALAQTSTTDMSVINKYIGLSNPPDQIKSKRDHYRKEIETSLRAAIATLPYAEAVEKASQMDGLMCLLALIALVEEIKADYARQLQEKYGLNMSGAAVSLEEKFEKFLDSVVAKITAKKRDSVTQAEIDGVIAATIKEYWQKLIKAKTIQPDQQPDEEFMRLVKNYAFLASASKVYRDTDDMQMLDLDKITLANAWRMGALVIRIYNMPTEKMIESYQALARCADQLILLEGEKERWGQLSVWLMGLYNRVYRAIKPEYIRDGVVQKLPNGQYPTVDSADQAFLKHKKITKYFMALFNKELSLALALKLGLVQNNVNDSSSAAAVAAPASGVNARSFRSPAAPVQSEVVHCEQLPGGMSGWRLIVDLPDCNKDRKDSIYTAIQSFYDEEQLWKWLKQSEFAGDDDKINRLEFCIRYFSLSPAQNERLVSIWDDVKSEFRKYRTANILFSRTHAGKSLEAEQQISNATNPKQQLEILFLLRVELIAQRSDSLRKAVDKILLSAFTQLVMPDPELSARADKLVPEIKYELIDSGQKGARLSVVVTDEKQRDRMITELTEQVISSQKVHDLCKWESVSDDDKIKRLALFINHNKLSSRQADLLRFLLPQVEAQFKAYRSANGFMGNFFSMTHAEKSSVAEERLKLARTSEEQLSILFELRNELIGDNSDRLLQAVNSILLSAYHALVLSPDVKQSAAVRM